MKHKLWLIVSSALALYVLVKFWPDYNGNMFPLFTDVLAVFLFLPAFFILAGIISHLIFALIEKKGLDKEIGNALVTLIFLTSFAYSLSITEFRLGTKVFISLICALLGFAHFTISNYLRMPHDKDDSYSII